MESWEFLSKSYVEKPLMCVEGCTSAMNPCGCAIGESACKHNGSHHDNLAALLLEMQPYRRVVIRLGDECLMCCKYCCLKSERLHPIPNTMMSKHVTYVTVFRSEVLLTAILPSALVTMASLT